MRGGLTALEAKDLLERLERDGPPYLAGPAYRALRTTTGQRAPQPAITLGLYFRCLRHLFAVLGARLDSTGALAERHPAYVEASLDGFLQARKLAEPARGDPLLSKYRVFEALDSGLVEAVDERNRQSHELGDPAPDAWTSLLAGLVDVLTAPVLTVRDDKGQLDKSRRIEVACWRGTGWPFTDVRVGRLETETGSAGGGVLQGVAYLELREVNGTSHWLPLGPTVFVGTQLLAEGDGSGAGRLEEQSLFQVRPPLRRGGEGAAERAWADSCAGARVGTAPVTPAKDWLRRTWKEVMGDLGARPRPWACRLAPSTETGLDPGIEAELGSFGWSIERRLGAGSFGIVVRARRASSQEPFALKILHPKIHLDQTDRLVLARLEELDSGQVPGLVRHYPNPDFARGSVRFLVMECIEGETLDREVGRLDAEATWSLVRALTRVLKRMHDRSIVHRDIHFRNVMVRRSTGGPVLIDLGLARWNLEIAAASLRGSSAAWWPRWGLEPYAPPAQRTGDIGRTPELWAAADVHAMAHVIAYVLAPRSIVPGVSLASIAARREEWRPELKRDEESARRTSRLLAALEQVVATWESEAWNGRSLRQVVAESLAGPAEPSPFERFRSWTRLAAANPAASPSGTDLKGPWWMERRDGAIGLLFFARRNRKEQEQALEIQSEVSRSWLAPVIELEPGTGPSRKILIDVGAQRSIRLTRWLDEPHDLLEVAWLVVGLLRIAGNLEREPLPVGFVPQAVWVEQGSSRPWVALLTSQVRANHEKAWAWFVDRLRRRVREVDSCFRELELPSDLLDPAGPDGEVIRVRLDEEEPPSSVSDLFGARGSARDLLDMGAIWHRQQRDLGPLLAQALAALGRVFSDLLHRHRLDDYGLPWITGLLEASLRVNLDRLTWPTRCRLKEMDSARAVVVEDARAAWRSIRQGLHEVYLAEQEGREEALLEHRAQADRLTQQINKQSSRSEETGRLKAEQQVCWDQIKVLGEQERGFPEWLGTREGARLDSLSSFLAAEGRMWRLPEGLGGWWEFVEGGEILECVVPRPGRVEFVAGPVEDEREPSGRQVADLATLERQPTRSADQLLVSVGSALERLEAPDRQTDQANVIDPGLAKAHVVARVGLESLVWLALADRAAQADLGWARYQEELVPLWFSPGRLRSDVGPALLRERGSEWSPSAEALEAWSRAARRGPWHPLALRDLYQCLAQAIEASGLADAAREPPQSRAEPGRLSPPFFRMRHGELVWALGPVPLDETRGRFGAPPLLGARIETVVPASSSTERLTPR